MHKIVRNNAPRKYKPSLHRQGLAQTVVGDDKEIPVNGNAARFHCKFCWDNHAMPYCSRWKFFMERATEYLISTSTPTVETDVCNRIMYGMPLPAVGKGTVFSTVNTNFTKCDFVIEEACMVNGMVQHHIKSMSFCDTFLTKKGDTGTGWGVYLDIGGNYEHNTCTSKHKV